MATGFRAGQGRTIGNRRVYRRTNCQPFISKYQCLSIPVWDIERWNKKVQEVLIYDERSHTRYIADADLFRHAEPVETDWGSQVFCDINDFQMEWKDEDE